MKLSATMDILQFKHSKLNEKDSEELLEKLNISESQLPKIFSDDTALPEGCEVGDIIKIKRKSIPNPSSNSSEKKSAEDKPIFYYRVVV